MTATVDKDGCIGCGLCESICPEVFRMEDDGKAKAYAEVTGENKGAAFEAEQSCPVSVIAIIED